MRVKAIQAVEPIKANKLKACAYARVSTDEESQGRSLENQETHYKNAIASNPSYEFAGVYTDQGISGYSENRPGFQKMLDEARKGNVDLIITKSISRFARNTVTILKVARELKNLGIAIFFEEQNINTLSQEGELLMTTMAAFAEEESKAMRDNLKWTIQKKFERGDIIINTTRFLGYDLDEYGDMVINQKQAALVRKIFQMYLDGMGCFKIAKELNREKIPTITDAKWGESTIKGILTNEKYKGDYLLQKYYTPEGKRRQTTRNRGELQSYYINENHPAIIPPEEWEKVQLLMKEHAEKKGIDYENLDKYQNRYPLTGMLVCPYCGKKLRRRYVYDKKVQWICSTYILDGKNVCKGVRIDDDWIKKQNISKPTVVEEVTVRGEKRYRLTEKDLFDLLEEERKQYASKKD